MFNYVTKVLPFINSMLIIGIVVQMSMLADATQPIIVEETVIVKDTVDVPVVTVECEDVPKSMELGTFKLTAYCPCEHCSDEYGNMTATGTKAKAGRTIAVDPKVIPYGTEVIINGNTYIAEDCGGAIKGNIIDVYFDDHSETLDFGVQYADVYKVN